MGPDLFVQQLRERRRMQSQPLQPLQPPPTQQQARCVCSGGGSPLDKVIEYVLMFNQHWKEVSSAYITVTSTIVLCVFAINEIVNIVCADILGIHSYFVRFLIKCVCIYLLYKTVQHKQKMRSDLAEDRM